MADRLVLSHGWRRWLTAFAAGCFSALALPPFHAMPVMFVTMPVLVLLLDGTAGEDGRRLLPVLRQSFAIGWWFGFGYFLAGLWWIGNAFLVEAERFAFLMPVAVLALPAFLAIFHGVSLILARLLWRRDWRRVLALGGALALGEFARGHLFTGFPWNPLGQTALPFLPMLQKVSFLGVYGVAAIALPLFAVPALLLGAGRKARWFAASAIAMAMAADIGYGYWRLQDLPAGTEGEVRLRLVQPSIDQSEKWSLEVQDRHLQTLLSLSRDKPGDEDDGYDLLIWPESAFPFFLTDRSDALAALGALLPENTILATGAIRRDPAAPVGSPAFNSVYLIDENGVISGAADKVQLVPFGEYIPFRQLVEPLGLVQLTHLRSGFRPGSQRRVLDTGPAGAMLALICYEIIFSGRILPEKARPDWILNVTNDAWFGLTPGPYQHWQQAVTRGVETGLPVVRVANSGITSVTDATGRIIARTELGARQAVNTRLPPPGPVTLFARFGQTIFWGIIASFLAILAIPVHRS